MKDFRDLKVWEKAHELALTAYAATTNFPKQEIFGIVSQIRRAATSIGANIAEGCGRGGNAEFQRFCTWRWDLQMSWSITCCCQRTFISCLRRTTGMYKRRWWK